MSSKVERLHVLKEKAVTRLRDVGMSVIPCQPCRWPRSVFGAATMAAILLWNDPAVIADPRLDSGRVPRASQLETPQPLLHELSSHSVSGERLAEQAGALQAQWEAYVSMRAEMASAWASVAAGYEAEGMFAQALALYGKIGELFPEQRGLIGEIMRDRAFADVTVDLSTPTGAFLALKKGLMTYNLTSLSFWMGPGAGIDRTLRGLDRDELERRLSNLRAAASRVEGEADLKQGSLAESIPEGGRCSPGAAAWLAVTRYVMTTSHVSLDIKKTSLLEIQPKSGFWGSVDRAGVV